MSTWFISTVWECPRCIKTMRVYSKHGEIASAFTCTKCERGMIRLDIYPPDGARHRENSWVHRSLAPA